MLQFKFSFQQVNHFFKGWTWLAFFYGILCKDASNGMILWGSPEKKMNGNLDSIKIDPFQELIPVVMRSYPLPTDLSRGSERQQPQVLQLIKEVLFYKE